MNTGVHSPVTDAINITTLVNARLMRWMCALVTLLSVVATATASQNIVIPKLLREAQLNQPNDALALLNSAEFNRQLQQLAKQLPAKTVAAQTVFNQAALLSIRQQHKQLAQLISEQPYPMNYYHYSLYHQAWIKLGGALDNTDTAEILSSIVSKAIAQADNKTLFKMDAALGWSVDNARNYVFNLFKQARSLELLTTEELVMVVANVQLYQVVSRVIPIAQALLLRENMHRYEIQPDVLVSTPAGTSHSVTIVRPKDTPKALPAALQFTIYADEKAHIRTATHAAAHGYVGVVANSRGKRSSKDTIVPWEHEGEDANQVIHWISKQGWNDGQVVMYGGSYNGFTQWAAAKYAHPALKAIAPYTAANLATGLPMENNIVLTANYQWAFHVTNNKTTDQSEYADWQYWRDFQQKVFQHKGPFKDIDRLEGRENPWFKKWLSHPSYDEYFQKMVPYGKDYLKINIPVLTITGYFDGGQISAIDYLTQHYKHNPKANHRLLIGPYTHRTAQGIPNDFVGNYALDPVALEKDTESLVFQWFDYLLYQKPLPQLLQDRVNYQLMGSNRWQHISSYDELNRLGQIFYLSVKAKEEVYGLQTQPQAQLGFIEQQVDMADRTVEHNLEPADIISESLPLETGIAFVTEAFEQTMQFAGAPTGYISLSVNKRDVDIGFNLYQITPEGKAFHLTRYIGRASYADDMSKRQLLTPNKKTRVPLVNPRMTARLLEKGSKLALVLDVNKNRGAQVNLGSGKAVSEETIADVGEALTIRWYTDSEFYFPITPFKQE